MKDINASSLKDIADCYNKQSHTYEFELNSILKELKKVASQGRYDYNYTNPTYSKLKEDLQKLGFIIKAGSARQYNYFHISWGHNLSDLPITTPA